ncbi:hypothetical protein ILUMI_25024 [Ignelater luminosus]|uniref:Uncharacterized protein n=1 Tax=Ignelater luminosus TaxID=2038154 RepID=A0A8K0C5C7_IGNLU|nr:hypothetical protein ILUMI_25024 [Ignelater luminosus]
MKLYILLCVVTLTAAAKTATLTPEQGEKLREVYKTCVESSHVDTALVAKARNGDFTEDGHLDDFFTCMFTSVGFINDEGQLQKDVIRSKVPADISKEDVDKVFAACAKIKDEPKGKISKLAYKCYLSETPVKVQLIEETA